MVYSLTKFKKRSSRLLNIYSHKLYTAHCAQDFKRTDVTAREKRVFYYSLRKTIA
jgi:hypothetical protein